MVHFGLATLKGLICEDFCVFLSLSHRLERFFPEAPENLILRSDLIFQIRSYFRTSLQARKSDRI